jgi:hypothetical protein
MGASTVGAIAMDQIAGAQRADGTTEASWTHGGIVEDVLIFCNQLSYTYRNRNNRRNAALVVAGLGRSPP